MSRALAPAVERPLAIACVYARGFAGAQPGAMNVIRFVRVAEALARRGHRVHLVARHAASILPAGSLVHAVEPESIRWDDYDVVKTAFHGGFQTLSAWHGADHPCIVSNLGSVVGSEVTEGVYFYGSVREELWAIQQQVAARSRFVSLLTKRNHDLWHRMHGDRDGILMVPGGVDAEVPAPGANPYLAAGITRPVVLYAGNIYPRDKQAEVNLFWQERLNALGRALNRLGMQLVVMGPGETDQLDPAVVVHLGVVDFRHYWNWQWYASVGVALAQGPVQDNESSKIYYYLRTGLPVVCEAPIPNANLVSQTGHGAVVPYDGRDVVGLAEAVRQMVERPPKADDVIPYIVAEHSWDARVAAYAEVLARVTPRLRASNV